MKNLVLFIKQEIHNKNRITSPSIYAPFNCFRLHLKEDKKNAAIKNFDLDFSKKEKDVIAVHLPVGQKIQQFLTKHAFICDYLVLFPSQNRILLIELKGENIPAAKKQIKHGYCFLEYIISLCNKFFKKTILLPNAMVSQLIISGSCNRASETNAQNRSNLQKDNEFFILRGSDGARIHANRLFNNEG